MLWCPTTGVERIRDKCSESRGHRQRRLEKGNAWVLGAIMGVWSYHDIMEDFLDECYDHEIDKITNIIELLPLI